jgi:hypothetical protein
VPSARPDSGSGSRSERGGAKVLPAPLTDGVAGGQPGQAASSTTSPGQPAGTSPAGETG